MSERRGLIQTVNFPRITGGYRELPAVAGGDPDFASVVLLLDFAGADGGTDITDLSASAHVDTFNNQAEIDTAITALGENTVLLPAGTPSVTFPDDADWDLGTADFTVECHFQRNVVKTGGLISTFDDPNGWAVQHTSANALRFLIGGTVVKSESWTPTASTMHHVSVARVGTNLRMFIDGVQLGTPTTVADDINGGSLGLFVGALLAGSNSVDGSIGAVRITKGVGRYSANFTPPTEFYPTS